MNIEQIVNVLAFTVYVAAARVDATPEQAAELRREILPLLDRYRAGEIHQDVIFRQVEQVMAPDWDPSGAWADQLDVLGFTRDDTGHTH